MIQINNLTLAYDGQDLLSQYTQHIPAGELTLITGPSGSGKTTLLKALIGLVPFTGQITIQNTPLTPHTCATIRSHTAYLPQDLALPYEYIAEAIAHILSLGGKSLDKKDTLAQMKHHLQLLHIEEELLARRMSEISGGQRQRILLATIALLHRPLMLLDEPTSALDQEARHQVAAFLQHLQQHAHTTILAVSHDHTLLQAAQHTITIGQAARHDHTITIGQAAHHTITLGQQ